MTLSLRLGAVSDVGRSRKKNDDSGYAGPHFVMVADGMGGAPAGDLASALAISTMRRLDAPAPDDMLEALAGAVHRANDRLAETIEEDSSVEGMGTTVTAVLFDGERIGVAHLGDSRGYLWRDGELLRLTSDHTWVQSLIDEGRINEEEAKVHSHRSLLLKVLDGRHDNDPDLTLYDVQAGDRILLCSDGLSSFVDHDRLERVMSIGNADAVATELVQLALEGASNDNITVVIADVVDEPASEAAPLVVGAAADPPRRPLGRLRAWGHREEHEPHEVLMTEDIDPEELRYAPREPRRYRWLRRGILAAVVLAVLVVGGMYSYGWSQDQYYVAEHDGKVAIFQGVQADLPGIEMHHVYEEQDLELTELPTYRRSQVLEGVNADDLDNARKIVAQLEGFAKACAKQEAQSSSSTNTTTKTTKTTKTTGPKSTGRNGTASTKQSGQGPTNTPKSSKSTKTTKEPPATTTQDTGTGGDSSAEECAGATPQSVTSR